MNAPDAPMYILRYPLPPEPAGRETARLERLARFCETARIDEVMFFILPEEYNRGQYRPADYRPWLELAARGKAMAEAAGLRTSLNPWHTLLHLDRGRTSPDLAYRRMVLDTGYECLSVACPLCEQWRALYLQAFTDFARAGFKTIWVEDDFRFHNHNYPKGWGGCFCAEHLAELRRRGAQAATREQLLANLNAPGRVHPDRQVWMDLNRDTYNELAALTRAAMDTIDPAIRLGLMTSHMRQHTLEGRDWPGLIAALGGPERAPVRPHACTYQESARLEVIELLGNLSHTLDALPGGTQSWIEIENAPMSIFAKSQQQTAMQMAFAVDGGCVGLTLDVLDFIGSGPASEPRMAATLAGQKDKLLPLRELTVGSEPLAIASIQPTTTTRLAPGSGEARLQALPTVNHGWATCLAAFGYPAVHRAAPGAIGPEKIFALAGPAVWAIPREQLEAMLARAVCLLDPLAVKIISHRGLGGLIGSPALSWLERDQSDFSIEQWHEPDAEGLPERASVNWPQNDFRLACYALPEAPGASGSAPTRASMRTTILDASLTPLGVGSFIYHNVSGGRGLAVPTLMPMPQEFYCWQRRHWLARMLGELAAPLAVPCALDSAWVYLSARRAEGRATLFLANTIFEVYESLPLQLPPELAQMQWSVALHGRDLPGQIELDAASGQLRLTTTLAGNDWVLLEGRAD